MAIYSKPIRIYIFFPNFFPTGQDPVMPTNTIFDILFYNAKEYDFGV